MAKGIDIYRRYQKVTSYQAVKNSGVTFAWVKATDGSGFPAGGKADAEVAGFKSVGIPVGLYHFSQVGSPTAQADRLLGEVNRLAATGVVAMLDMEDNPPGSGTPNIPPSQKRAWVNEFLNRVRQQGFKPCVYLNNADAKLIRPDTLGDDVIIVIARYGAMPAYGGRYDVHQHSSTGSVPGITGSVDLDESYNNRHLGAFRAAAPTPPVAEEKEDRMIVNAYPDTYEIVAYKTDNVEGSPTFGMAIPVRELRTKIYNFVVPVGANSSITKNAWINVTCAGGSTTIEFVRLYSIREQSNWGMEGGGYPKIEEWTNVPADSKRCQIQAADGQTTFTAMVKCAGPFSIGIEIEPK